MNRAFIDYYRCPESFVTFAVRGMLSGEEGYFQFGSDAVCYGRSSSNLASTHFTEDLFDVLPEVRITDETVWLPFDPNQVIDNLRCERYRSQHPPENHCARSSLVRETYYTARPFLPVSVRKHLQRLYFTSRASGGFPNWPVDHTVEDILRALMLLLLRSSSLDSIPFIWFWPDGLPSCSIITHDVESATGRDLCSRLMDVDDAHGIKSSFELVPERRYALPQSLLDTFRHRGFEIDIHDLNHDGRLFNNRELFLRRAQEINRYGQLFNAAGFRSAILYRNSEWLTALDFAYDMSVPSTGFLEAQAGGCCSVTPFFIGNLLELPVTTTQDYALFNILNQHSADLWKRQIALITEQNGLASFIIHPDYIFESHALSTYRSLLSYLAELRANQKLWIAQPRQVNDWWRARSRMRLVRHGQQWRIEGEGSELARVAYASIDRNRLVFELAQSCEFSSESETVVGMAS
jgi:hypothetical protein